MERRTVGVKRRGRTRWVRRTALAAGALVVLTASAAIAGAFRSGNLETPPYAGDGWQLIVGEEANGDSGSFKVCHKWAPTDEAPNEANGFGPSGCVTWPDDATETIIMDAISFNTPHGSESALVFVDLTAEPVDTVVAILDDGSQVETAPFVMPQTSKQFAVLELPVGTSAAEIQLLKDGDVVESRTSISTLQNDFGDPAEPGA
jgi:hypothetical protein